MDLREPQSSTIDSTSGPLVVAPLVDIHLSSSLADGNDALDGEETNAQPTSNVVIDAAQGGALNCSLSPEFFSSDKKLFFTSVSSGSPICLTFGNATPFEVGQRGYVEEKRVALTYVWKNGPNARKIVPL